MICLFNFVLVGPPYLWSPDLPCSAQPRPPGGAVAHSAPLLDHKRERRLAVNPTRLLGSVTVHAVTAAAAHRTAEQEHEQLLNFSQLRIEPAGPDPDRSSGTAAMSPLQLSVYWRLALLFFFTPFLFFLDIFTAAIADRTCRHNNGTGASSSWLGTIPPSADNNQSQYEEVPELSADWRTDESQVHVS